MALVIPKFQIHFRRHLPKAPEKNSKDVSAGKVEPSCQSVDASQTQTMDVLPKKRLTPEVVAMLLSMDGVSDSDEALSRRNTAIQEVVSSKHDTKMSTADDTSMKLFNSVVSAQNNIRLVNIMKSSDQPLGFSLREGSGSETEEAGRIFVSKLTIGGIVEENYLLSVGDEILEINHVPVHGYKLSDVVAMIQIPKKLVLKVRLRQISRRTRAGGIRCKPFAGKPVLGVNNNNNNYVVAMSSQNTPDDNSRNGSKQRLSHTTQGNLRLVPNSLPFRRSSSGRLLPEPPDFEVLSGVPDKCNLQGIIQQPKPISTDRTLRTETNQVKKTSENSLNWRFAESTEMTAGKRTNRRELTALFTESREKGMTDGGSDSGISGKEKYGVVANRGQETSGYSSKRVDPGDIRFDLVSTDKPSSGTGIFSSTLEEVTVERKRDATPTSSPCGLRKTSAPAIFGSSSSLSSSDSPKSQSRKPLQAKSPCKLPPRLSLSEMRIHSSRSSDCSPVSSSAESEEQVKKNTSSNDAKQNPDEKPLLLLHSHSSDEINQSHTSWFSKIGNQRRKYVRKFSEGAELRTPLKSTGEAYRLQEPLDSPNDEIDLGYRLFPGNVDGSGKTESRSTPRAVTGMLTLNIVKACRIFPGSAVSKDKRKKLKVFCTVDSDGIRHACTGTKKSLNEFQWNESFEIEFQRTREVKITVWMRCKKDGDQVLAEACLCLAQLLCEGNEHMLALCLTPSGMLYAKLQFTDMKVLLQRSPSQKKDGVFGIALETVLRRENSRIPLLVKKCVEEINGRGLEITGIYRLCGNAAKKRTLRAQFENNSAIVDLTQTENPSDVNVITGLLKDYLRELPHPLLSQEVREILYEAFETEERCESSDQCLVNKITSTFSVSSRATITYLLDHFAMVLMNSDVNKMDSHNLAVCIGPVLLCPSPGAISSNIVSDTKKDINAVKLLLEIWPKPEQVSAC